MTSYTLYESILGLIEDTYPAESHPAENAFLRERYAWQPEVSPAMEEAMTRCLVIIRHIEESNPSLLSLEAEGIGMDQFLEEYAETLHEEAQSMFSAEK